ncbi:MAG: pyridoxal-dependent decarboxylase [Halioglobus sp.]
MIDFSAEIDEPSLLDPEDWPAFREQAHMALDQALDFVQQRPQQAVWRELPDRIKALDQEVPIDGSGMSSVLDEVAEDILPYSLGNTHPRFWGWVNGSGTASGLVSQMMIAALNANLGGRDHAPIYVERQLIRWMHELFGFPLDEASGTVVTGTSSATLLGLSVARQRATAGEWRKDGNGQYGLVAYTSAQSHVSVSKAMEMMGLGSDALRSVPVMDDFSMNCDLLCAMVDEDRRAGLMPFAVVSTVGSVNTGAIDDLPAINRLCRESGLWHHVDGAFGALAILAEQLKPRLDGISSADSIAFDFHKWLHVGYAAGCLLVRDGEVHRQTFANSHAHSYLQSEKSGIAGGAPWPTDYGIDLSRGFSALGAWFQLKEQGVTRLGRAIYRNCLQAEWLGAAVEQDPTLQLMAPVNLNIVCFCFRQPGLTDDELNQLNRRIVVELQCRGIAAPSVTELFGCSVIRVCITNHRTRKADLEALLSAVGELALELLP